MTNKTIYRNYLICIHLLFTTSLFALVVCGISTSIAVAASDGLALKTTMPTAADASTEETVHSADDVARELANPNSSLATLTLKNQYRWYTGDLPGADDQDNFTMVFQPVFPLSMPADDNGNNRTLFIRPGFPLLFDQPVPSEENGALDWDGISALGDIGFDIGYGVSAKSGLLWAVGMVGTLPTATDDDVGGNSCALGRSSCWRSLRIGASMAFSPATNGMLPAGQMNPLVPHSSNPCSRLFWVMARQQGLRP
ncbi:hypothetical protein C6A37_01745 [Desulfobacteraceae bacterium SEEP-SAG9]|nr:hypothetical protein C6A37_01745 [Desulfobacteraceae bacterium SEEP-SAG9]